MSMFGFLRSRYWVIGRRVALIALVVILGIRNYGDTLSSWLRPSNPQRDVVVIKAEFRPEFGEKPAWIIGLRNISSKTTYDQIEIEATYMDDKGKVMETDKLVVRQKLTPGHEQTIASTDHKSRPGARTGTLRVVGARSEKP
jgi:hypothetical protein